MLKTGPLRHRVRIERLTAGVQDPVTGEVAQTWVTVAEVWAAIAPLSAREFIQSDAKQAMVTARVTLRYRDDLDASVRLVHLVNGVPGRIYNPQGFLPDADSGLEYLTAPCTEGVGVGQ